MQCVRNAAGPISGSITGVPSEDDIIRYYRDGLGQLPQELRAVGATPLSSSGDPVALRVWAGVVFKHVGPPNYDLPNHVEYSIRINGSDIPDTNEEGPSILETESGLNTDKGLSYVNS